MSERPALGALLRDRSTEILASWVARFERSPLRFRRATQAAAHAAQVENLLETLGVATSEGVAGMKPGSDTTRELERSVAFLGAQFASEGATGYDIAALLLELRHAIDALGAPDAERAALASLFEWLTVVALDGFAASGLQALRERVADELELGTPVVEILPRVPAVLFVGAPSASLVGNLLARAWMLAVGTSAPCLVIDCAGLAEPAERAFFAGYEKFLEQAAGSAIQVLLCTARRSLRGRIEAASRERAVPFQHFERLDSAVAHALERTGHLLMRRA